MDLSAEINVKPPLCLAFVSRQVSLIKTVFLIDPRWQGHHLTYIKLFTPILLQQNYQVIVLCPKPDEVYKLILDTMPDSIAQLHVDKLIESKPPSINILGMGALYPTFSRWYLTTNAIAPTYQLSFSKPKCNEIVNFIAATLRDYLPICINTK